MKVSAPGGTNPVSTPDSSAAADNRLAQKIRLLNNDLDMAASSNKVATGVTALQSRRSRSGLIIRP